MLLRFCMDSFRIVTDKVTWWPLFSRSSFKKGAYPTFSSGLPKISLLVVTLAFCRILSVKQVGLIIRPKNLAKHFVQRHWCFGNSRCNERNNIACCEHFHMWAATWRTNAHSCCPLNRLAFCDCQSHHVRVCSMHQEWIGTTPVQLEVIIFVSGERYSTIVGLFCKESPLLTGLKPLATLNSSLNYLRKLFVPHQLLWQSCHHIQAKQDPWMWLCQQRWLTNSLFLLLVFPINFSSLLMSSSSRCS